MIIVAVGVSFNKIFAKLGSDMRKPDAITCITQESYKTQVWPLKASELLGVGPATTRKLALRNIHTIGELANCNPDLLRSWLGINGIKLWQYANGADSSRVSPYDYAVPIKSISNGITCTADLHTNEEVKSVLLSLAPRVSLQLREAELQATGVQLAVRDNELYFKEFQCKLPYPTQSWRELVEMAMELFLKRYRWEKPIRAVCIRAINLINERTPLQYDLFGDYERRDKIERLERAVDDIHRRFGDDSVVIAATMQAKLKKDKAREMLIMPASMYV